MHMCVHLHCQLPSGGPGNIPQGGQSFVVQLMALALTLTMRWNQAESKCGPASQQQGYAHTYMYISSNIIWNKQSSSPRLPSWSKFKVPKHPMARQT